MKPFAYVSRLGNVSTTRTSLRAAATHVRGYRRFCGRHWLLILTSGVAFAWPGLAHADGLDPELVGTWPGYARGPVAAVAVQNGLAYVAAGSGGIHVLDVHNPASPVRVGACDMSEYASDVAVVGNYAYVADWDAGLQVIDVSSPASPVRVGGYDTSGSAYGVAVAGNYAYVADGDAGLQVIDVSKPASPVRVGGYDTPGSASGSSASRSCSRPNWTWPQSSR